MANLKQILKRKRVEYALFKKGLLGKAFYMKYPETLLDKVRMIKINYDLGIRDLGCGASNRYSLNEVGFKNLIGVDPYLFLGSEQYKRDIPLTEDSYLVNHKKSIFTKSKQKK